MAVKFGHAVMAEDGTNGKTGASIGDQTGKEIAFRDWYVSGTGWKWLLVCADEGLAERAAKYMEQIVADENFGYSQASKQRWSGYNAIVANGGEVAGAKGDFDCATLCISCYILAGLDHEPSGYTGSMYKSLMATGKFLAYTDKAHLSSGDYAKRGAIYLRNGHVAMALNDGTLAGGAIPIKEDIKTEGEYVLVSGSVNVREEPGTSGRFVTVARKGDKLPYTGKSSMDAAGGVWYQVETENGIGWISAFTNKQRKYTSLFSNT